MHSKSGRGYTLTDLQLQDLKVFSTLLFFCRIDYTYLFVLALLLFTGKQRAEVMEAIIFTLGSSGAGAASV